MARPVAMMSAALLTAAASGILPQFIGANGGAPPLPLPGRAAISTQMPGPASGPSSSGNGVSPGPAPIPTPAPSPNGVQAAGSIGLNVTPNQGQSTLISQTSTGTVTFRPDGDTQIGYLTLRNASGWPQQVKVELVLLQDRNGTRLDNVEMQTEFKGTFQIQAFDLRNQRLRIVFSSAANGKPTGETSFDSRLGQERGETVNPMWPWNRMAHRASALLPGSGWLRIRWLPMKPAGKCKSTETDVCKEPTDSTLLVAINLPEPPPDNSRTMGAIFFASLIAASFVISVVAVALVISKKPLLHRMGSATWSFQQSWGANVTIGAGLLGTFLTLFAFPDHPQLMDKGSYSALQVLFAAIITLAPLVYGLIRYDIQANANGVAAVDAQGYVIMFLLAGGLVLCGAIGQVATTGSLIEEFVLGRRLQTSLGITLEVLSAALCMLLVIYGVRSLYLTAKGLSIDAVTATGTQPQVRVQSGLPAPANVPSPMAEWPLL